MQNPRASGPRYFNDATDPWGPGAFQNTLALDWIIDLLLDESVVSKTLTLAFRHLEDEANMPRELVCRALCCIEVAAAQVGNPCFPPVAEVTRFIQDSPEPRVGQPTHQMIELAQAIRENESLIAIWSSMEALADWEWAMDDLIERLQAP